jgi:putative transposase
MAKPPRDLTRCAFNTYFITSTTYSGQLILQSDRMASLLLDTLLHYRRENKYQLHEYVIMPNHIHLLITPTSGLTIEKVMQFIKGGFSYRVRKELGLTVEVWERGYVDHRIRDARDFQQHVAYIRDNPVRAGLVPVPEAFPYSSAAPAATCDPCPQRLKPVA